VSTRSSAPTLLARASPDGFPGECTGVPARRDETGLDATIVGLVDGTSDRNVRLEETLALSGLTGVDGVVVAGAAATGAIVVGGGVEGTAVSGFGVSGAASEALLSAFGS